YAPGAVLAFGADSLVLASGSVNRSGLFQSLNGGVSWTLVGKGQWYRDFARQNGAQLWAATSNGVYRSATAGEFWWAAGLQGTSLFTIAWDPRVIIAGGVSIYRSTDNGTTWVPVYSTGSITESIVFASGSTVFAGTRAGVLVSHDLGQTWAPFSDGLPSPSVYRPLAIDSTGHLYTVAEGRGVFRSTERVITGSEPSVPPPSPAAIMLYPNPTRGTLHVQVAAPGPLALYVTDVLGRRLADLTPLAVAARGRAFPWDASVLPPGVYLLRALSESGTASRSFTVVR
ncbi:MAG TPA: T9SS type A sorting domain-containing protein, partial [Rubricoccaceae bacterium]|nr:T9SS type A sorting domain-containing protein [Rubricoccaceae bacterium]